MRSSRHGILPVTLETKVDAHLHLRVKKSRVGRGGYLRVSSLQAGGKPWATASMGLPRLAPRLDHCPHEPSSCHGGLCLQAQGGGRHSQVLGPGAVNRPRLSWHGRRGRVQGPCSVGSWGWGHQKIRPERGLPGDEVMWKNTQVRTKLSFCK